MNRERPRSSRKDWVLFLSIIILGVLAQMYTLPLVFGISINSAGIWYFVALRLWGLKRGMLSGVLISVIAFMLDSTNTYTFYYLIIVLIVGSLYEKRGKDIFTWTFVCSILLFLVPFITSFVIDYNDWSTPVSTFLFIQFLVELLFAALIADIFAVYLPHVPLIQKFFCRKSRLYFGQIIFNIIVVSAVTPIIIHTIIQAWMMQEDVLSQYQTRHQVLEMTLSERVNQLDEVEIQRLYLGSVIEKGHLNNRLDQFIGESDQFIYIFSQDHSVYMKTPKAPDYSGFQEKLVEGVVAPYQSDQFLWVRGDGSSVRDWKHGYFVTTTSFLNKQVDLYIPLRADVQKSLESLTTYFIAIMFVFTASFLFGTLGNYILTRSLNYLTVTTSELPEKLDSKETIPARTTRISEFSELGNNVEKVGMELKRIFSELNEKNRLLMERTEQLVCSERELFRVAHYDELTNLPNRHTFYQDIQKLVDNSELFALLFIDLDKFKDVNDTFGHSGGDQLLKYFANRLLQFEKQVEHIQIYRLAGDEFVAILQTESNSKVYEICNALLKNIKKPITIDQKEIQLTASVGISFYPTDGKTVDALLHAADLAMYQQKENGRNGLNIYREERGENDEKS